VRVLRFILIGKRKNGPPPDIGTGWLHVLPYGRISQRLDPARHIDLVEPSHILSSARCTMNKHSPKFLSLSRAVVLFLALGCSLTVAQTRQEHVHHMGSGVMPFDLAKTTHIFRMTESGGVQRVIANDATAKDQIALIQQHLKHEAEAFQRGNYSDPATLHGADMPGLKELEAGAKQVKVSYSALPAGAEITFKTSNRRLLTAIHRWFGAQLSEHGADARSE
jgi:hypothetical protein